MIKSQQITSPGCKAPASTSRREFLKGLSTVAATASTGFWPILTPSQTLATTKIQVTPETAVTRLYDSLDDGQKKVICLPWTNKWRQRFGANWAVSKPTIGEFFNADQQELIREIFRGVTSEEGYERFLKQMEEDYGGFGQYHIAIFGEPGGDGKFEWVMSGRHLTIRCDGNFEDGTAFGGPMVYGHGTGNSRKGLPGNLFYYQTLRANEVFGMLDGRQRKLALLDKAPRESDVTIGIGDPIAGRPVNYTIGADLAQQRGLAIIGKDLDMFLEFEELLFDMANRIAAGILDVDLGCQRE